MNKSHHLNNLGARLFPLGLIFLLLGLSFWLNQISSFSTKTHKLDPQKPEFIVEGSTAKRFDEKGNLYEVLNAKKTWQYPNSDVIHTQHPNFDIFEATEKKYHLEGDSAQYNNKTKTIYFPQSVKMIKMAEKNHPKSTIYTTQLTADTVAQTVSTRSKVDFTYGDSRGKAIGLYYNHKTGVLNLQSRVSATYEVNQNNKSFSSSPSE